MVGRVLRTNGEDNERIAEESCREGQAKPRRTSDGVGRSGPNHQQPTYASYAGPVSLGARYYRDHLRRLKSHPPPHRLPAPAAPVTEARSGLYREFPTQVALLLKEESLPPPEREWPCPVARQPRRNVSFRPSSRSASLPVQITIAGKWFSRIGRTDRREPIIAAPSYLERCSGRSVEEDAPSRSFVFFLFQSPAAPRRAMWKLPSLF